MHLRCVFYVYIKREQSIYMNIKCTCVLEYILFLAKQIIGAGYIMRSQIRARKVYVA